MGRPREFDVPGAVATATEEFWSRGYRGTTPQHLVDALGIGRGSLYAAFGSKQGLYLAALRHYHEHETARFVALLEGSGPARGRVAAALGLVARAVAEDGAGRGCLLANAAAELDGRDDEAAAVVRAAFDAQVAALRAAIAEAGAPGDPQVLADLMLALINGLRVRSRAGVTASDPQDVVTAALRLLEG